MLGLESRDNEDGLVVKVEGRFGLGHVAPGARLEAYLIGLGESGSC